MEDKNYIVGVDVGTSNVVMVVGTRQTDGMLNIEGVASAPVPATGVKAGLVENIQMVGTALRQAKQELEEELEIRIRDAYVGISGGFVSCASYTDHVFVKEPATGITPQDMEDLYGRMMNVRVGDDEQIMARIPQNYMVDGGQEISDPIGSFGHQLSSTFNFIVCETMPIQRLKMAMRQADMSIVGVCVNPVVTPDAVLSDEEKQEGAAVVDIGGGTTDISIYRGNALRYMVSVPMGANAINQDIRSCGILSRQVEWLKRKYGSAVADMVDDECFVTAPTQGTGSTNLLIKNLATIIEARVSDIIDLVWAEIKDAGYARRIPCGLVITGGGALLQNIDELFRRQTKMPVRLRQATFGINEESREQIGTFSNTTAVGVLLYGASKGDCMVEARRTSTAAPVQPVSSAPAQSTVTPKPQPQPVQPVPSVQPVPPIHSEPVAVAQSAAEAVPTEVAAADTVEQNDTQSSAQSADDDKPQPRKGWLGRVMQSVQDKMNSLFVNQDDEYL